MPRHSLCSRIVVVSACLFLLHAGPLAASAANKGTRIHRAPRQVREQIDELEEQFRAATLSGDVSAMDRLLSDDYVGIAWTGQVNTKATQMDHIRSRSLVVLRMDIADVKVKLLGSVAIVTGAATVEGTNEGSPMTGVYRYTRVYQRLAGGVWKITNSEATRIPKRFRDTASALPGMTP